MICWKAKIVKVKLGRYNRRWRPNRGVLFAKHTLNLVAEDLKWVMFLVWKLCSRKYTCHNGRGNIGIVVSFIGRAMNVDCAWLGRNASSGAYMHRTPSYAQIHRDMSRCARRA